MTFNQIRDQIKAASRFPSIKENKELNELIANLQAAHPEYFYVEKDERLRDRVFVHNPFSIPHKRYLREKAYKREGEKWIPA